MTARKTLDDYQVVARDFLLPRTFALLGDEPGVGKTGPALMAAWEKVQDTGLATLWTAPAYLLANAAKEISDFIPQARVVIVNGNGYQERRDQLATNSADFILTSYNNWSAQTKGEYLYRDLLGQRWSSYIFDEAHRLRGRNSLSTKHVFKSRLMQCANRETPLWLLTGTPQVRDGGDFFTYFHLWDKATYRSYWKFVEEYCSITKNPWKTDVGNIKRSMNDEFRSLLDQFTLRRTVKEIPQLSSLEFVETHHTVQLPKSVVDMIKKAKKEYVLEHPDLASPEFLEGSGALYVAQRKLATTPPTVAKPKIDWLKDYLSDKKGLTACYVWFKDSAKEVAAAITSKTQPVFLVSGDISAARRLDVLEKWKKSGNGLLVATIPSLKEGVTLVECKDLVFLEHSELPADQEQVIKRFCRRGQEHLVQVHHVDADKSVDMAIRSVLTGRDQGISEALRRWVATDVDSTQEEWFN